MQGIRRNMRAANRMICLDNAKLTLELIDSTLGGPSDGGIILVKRDLSDYAGVINGEFHKYFDKPAGPVGEFLGQASHVFLSIWFVGADAQHVRIQITGSAAMRANPLLETLFRDIDEAEATPEGSYGETD